MKTPPRNDIAEHPSVAEMRKRATDARHERISNLRLGTRGELAPGRRLVFEFTPPSSSFPCSINQNK
jgi:hypothetical protein